MARRNLSELDRDMNQAWGRIVSESIVDGGDQDEQKISEGGLIAGQTAHGVLAVSATQVYNLGTKLEQDGKVYRYSKCSTATAGVAGTLAESAEFQGGKDALEDDLVVGTTCAAAASTVYSTLVSSGATAANAFTEGYFCVSDGGAAHGQGSIYKILTSSVTTGAAACTLTIENPLEVVLTAGTSKVTLIGNPYKDWKIAATTPVGMVVGIPRVAVPITTPYCWLQTKGIATCKTSTGSASTIGKKLHRDVLTAGSVIIDNTVVTTSTGFTSVGSDILTECVGRVVTPSAAADNGILFLDLE